MRFIDKMIARRRTRLWLARLLDRLLPVRSHRVVFVTRPNVAIAGNLRIVLDALADAAGGMPRRELAVFKDGPIAPETATALAEKGVKVFERFSLGALCFVLSSATVVLSHSARDAFLPGRRRGRRVINVWHGVALKRIELLMEPRDDAQSRARRSLMARNARLYDALIASSPVDRVVNAQAFGLPFEKVHVTGLPRFDYLRTDWPLPRDLRRQADALDSIVGGRRLVLYAPTFRETGNSPLDWMNDACIASIRALCRRMGLVFGLRPHPYEKRPLDTLCDGVDIIDASAMRFAEAALLLRRADALIVDYSSIWVDFLATRKPILGLVPDYDRYCSEERGFVYTQESIFPGPLHHDWQAVFADLERLARVNFEPSDAHRLDAAAGLFLPPDRLAGSCTQRCISVFFDEPDPRAAHASVRLGGARQ
ncbi:CDP-glycerol glycerophosphotransferase family protein [Caballeronia sp. LZ029]|uniref:CDP-glycerol glycerophosphotransferase family protein n=1 Tax=Caballeronia sp. LZ029 TaxID=3038564 RepID=UPI002860B6D8|nr:CDP-glycerol glycerophosphotransferase family protein [Caballeronia sp. LZ029]MDR5744500.1 CDP-glycerol glycerophosphotransferase family protein [Caballeronia sp. LZ029]